METEEFEFKPLTDGLGFHRKAEQMKTDRKNSAIAKDMISRTLPQATEKSPPTLAPSSSAYESISKLMTSLPMGTEFKSDHPRPSKEATQAQPKVFQPVTGPGLGNPAKMAADLPEPGTPAHGPGNPESRIEKRSRLAETLSPLLERKMKTPLPTIPVPAFVSPQTHLKLTKKYSLNLPIVLIDAMVVSGVAILCLVAVLLVTKVNLVGLLSDTRTELSTRMDIALLFLFVMHFYLLASRSFFGATLGEWAFETEMGTAEQRKRGIYPYQILLRSLLLTVTGFVLFPVLSLLFHHDILEKLTGVRLHPSIEPLAP